MPPAPSPRPTVDVWVVATDHLDAAALTRMEALLTAAEHERGARFYRQRDRDTFVVARALIRTRLSLYGPTAPADWRFVVNDHQCPFVEPSQAGDPPLYFNVSHTAGMVALAVVRGHHVGIDVERVDRTVTERLPERHFAPAEVRDLRALPANEQPRAFFDYWTMKEAYIKARGMGLALPLDHFAFAFRAGVAPAIAFEPGFDAAERWQFWQAWPGPDHRLGLAIERDGEDLPIRLQAIAADVIVP